MCSNVDTLVTTSVHFDRFHIENTSSYASLQDMTPNFFLKQNLKCIGLFFLLKITCNMDSIILSEGYQATYEDFYTTITALVTQYVSAQTSNITDGTWHQLIRNIFIKNVRVHVAWKLGRGHEELTALRVWRACTAYVNIAP